MTLADLVQSLEGAAVALDRRTVPAGAAGVTVTAIAYDSRTAPAGSMFVALKGQRADGAAFAHDAIGRGAVAVVAETPPAGAVAVPWITVGDGRLALALLADAFYGHPSRTLTVVGITGTNGKTTTAYLTSALFEAAGVKAGLLGTVSYRIGAEEHEAERTTPEAPDLQAMMRAMVDRGCGACALEVSSHALALRRVDGMAFAAAVFTNLTRDHLDYHGSMAAYFAAKRRLFEMLPAGAPAVINLDDPQGRALCDVVSRPVTYAINQPADVTPGPLSFSMEGLGFEVRTPRGLIRVRSKLVGRANVYNLLAAVTAGLALDLPFSAVERGVAAVDRVPGRFQVVSTPADDVMAVVDYAHTDDALKGLLETVRHLAAGRLITVFGCGGERDRAKRPLMGAVAARLSELVILTSDNPRGEDPMRIIEDIKRGLAEPGSEHLVIEDRGAAIRTAVEIARASDVILVAGKGHEKTQVLKERVVPFDDVVAVREALARRRAKLRVS